MIKKIGEATLYLGDSYEIMPALGSFDSCVTDPPYEFQASGGGIFRRNRDCMDRIQAMGIDKGFDHTFLLPTFAQSVICFSHNDQLHKLLPWFNEHYDRHTLCMWHKSNPMPFANKHYKPDTEFYIHAWMKDFAPIGTLAQKDRYVMAPVGKSKYEHPTVKPDKVMDKILANVAGDTVFDPFMGTGSTAIAALKAGKKFVGIEREEKWFNVACKRIEDFYNQPDIFR